MTEVNYIAKGEIESFLNFCTPSERSPVSVFLFKIKAYNALSSLLNMMDVELLSRRVAQRLLKTVESKAHYCDLGEGLHLIIISYLPHNANLKWARNFCQEINKACLLPQFPNISEDLLTFVSASSPPLPPANLLKICYSQLLYEDNLSLPMDKLLLLCRDVSDVYKLLALANPLWAQKTCQITDFALTLGEDMALKQEDMEKIRLAAILSELGFWGENSELALAKAPLLPDEAEIVCMKERRAIDRLCLSGLPAEWSNLLIELTEDSASLLWQALRLSRRYYDLYYLLCRGVKLKNPWQRLEQAVRGGFDENLLRFFWARIDEMEINPSTLGLLCL